MISTSAHHHLAIAPPHHSITLHITTSPHHHTTTSLHHHPNTLLAPLQYPSLHPIRTCFTLLHSNTSLQHTTPSHRPHFFQIHVHSRLHKRSFHIFWKIKDRNTSRVSPQICPNIRGIPRCRKQDNKCSVRDGKMLGAAVHIGLGLWVDAIQFAAPLLSIQIRRAPL